MSEAYFKMTANSTCPCSNEDYEKLTAELEKHAKEQNKKLADGRFEEVEDSGVEFEMDNGQLFFFSEDYTDIELLSKNTLKILGEIITKAKRPHWEAVFVTHDSKMGAGTCDANMFRIYPDGEVRFPIVSYEMVNM